MMGYTDLHFLKLVDLLMPGVDLYTEMDVAQAFIRRDHYNVKEYHGINGRLILQLGGSDPDILSACAKKAKLMGYDAVNLNVGCPSSKVVKGKIGAILMRDPSLVARCVEAMANHHVVSVKTRLGLDDDPDNLSCFVRGVLAAGAGEVIIHARRAWLNGIDPKQNRNVPPLDYSRVCEIKLEFPEARIILNGGINSIEVAKPYIEKVDGFMLGRAFCSDPLFVVKFAQFLGLNSNNMKLALINYLEYVEAIGVRVSCALRHTIPYFKGFCGAAIARSRINSMMQSGVLNKELFLELIDRLSAVR